MSETIEVNGTEVEVSETDDGFIAEPTAEPVMQFTDFHNDSISIPLGEEMVIEEYPDDSSNRNDYIVGTQSKADDVMHKSGAREMNADVRWGYYFDSMELTEE